MRVLARAACAPNRPRPRLLLVAHTQIGDDDLLEILGQAKNPAVIQSHLKKLFAGIFKVKFSEGNKAITHMCSLAGEEVPLVKPVTITDAVEVWLKQLNENMKETLTQLIAGAIQSGQTDIEKLPSQVLCVAEVVAFTRDCEAAIKGGRPALTQLKEALRARHPDEPRAAFVRSLVEHVRRRLNADPIPANRRWAVAYSPPNNAMKMAKKS